MSKNSALKTRNHFAPFLLYLALSVGIFGTHVVRHPATFYVGEGTDPSQMMWLLVWWPYALIHRLDPFLTKVVWIPKGVNLAWMTCIPAPSLFAFPITYSFGPVVSYNVLSLLAPALSAWAAYYLCASVTGAFAPALLGGYLYGFSTYEAGQVLGGHLSLSLVFIPPLLVYLYLRLIAGAISQRRFVICFTAMLVIQFLISNEILATATVFGLMALLVAWCIGDSDIQSRLRRTIPGLVVCYIIAAALLTPYLYHTFAYGTPQHPLYPPERYSADLVGFILPNILSYFHHPFLGLDSRRFLPDPWENGAYLGIPILVLAVWYFVENRGTFTARLLASLLLLLCLAALGPVLHVAGWPSLPLPWTVSVHLPLLKHALPGRFTLYAFMVLAIIASIWLSRPSGQPAFRLALLVLCVLSLWPSVSSSRITVAPFFTSGTYKFFLRKDENVLVFPFGRTGESMLWQAESLMYFRMAGGWLGPEPAEFEHWPIVQAFLSSVLMPEADTQLKAFLAQYRVEAVLLGDSHMVVWSDLFSKLDHAPVRIGGVTIYQVGTAAFNKFRHADTLQVEGRAGVDQSKPPSPLEEATQIERPHSLFLAETPGPVASSTTSSNIKTDDSPKRTGPVVTAVNGTAVSKTSLGNPQKGNGMPVVPARRASWGPWWREAEADDVVVIDGHGFDTQNGVAVDLYCACPGGEVGPFFFEPDYHPFNGTQIFFKVPIYGANAPLAGPGSIVVSNKGTDGQYAAKSNRVPVWIGSRN